MSPYLLCSTSKICAGQYWDNVVEKLKARGINILEQTMISGGRRVCFFEGPDGVQLEFIEMKS